MMSFRQLFALTGLSALEVIRQPICLLLSISCVTLTAVTPMVLLHQFSEAGKLARDGGLALQFVIGVFVAGYAACSTLSREIREGTVATVLSKPIPRSGFLLAKFFGLLIVIVAFSTCTASATLLAGRVAEQWVTGTGDVIDWRTGRLLLAAPALALALAGLLNYFRRCNFSSTAFLLLLLALLSVFLLSGSYDRLGHPAAFDFRVDWRIVPASFMIALALSVLAAIALCVSTRFGMAPTLTTCVILFVGGLMSEYCFGGRLESSFTAGLLYSVIPNWQHFWTADALTGGGTISGLYVLMTGIYALVYTTAVLLLGMVSLKNVDL
jgi:hypothetical protein